MTKTPGHRDHSTPDRDPTFAGRVRAVIAGLQPGEVVTYGEVASEVGAPGSARAVGRLLATDGGGNLPWWRVVTSTGRLVPGHEERHARLLRAEGVRVPRGHVDIRRR